MHEKSFQLEAAHERSNGVSRADFAALKLSRPLRIREIFRTLSVRPPHLSKQK